MLISMMVGDAGDGGGGSVVVIDAIENYLCYRMNEFFALNSKRKHVWKLL